MTDSKTNYSELTTANVTVADGIARVEIANPPINLFTVTMMIEFATLGPQLAADDDVRVVVVTSADPDFWIAHATSR